MICCTDTAISPKIGEFFPECADIERATPESLHIDSFVLIELLLGLESAFDFEFEDEMLDPETFQTMRQARYVEKRFREGEITNKTMQERRHYNLQLVYRIGKKSPLVFHPFCPKGSDDIQGCMVWCST